MKEKIKQLEQRIEMLELLVKALQSQPIQYIPTYYPPYTQPPVNPLNPAWTCQHNIKAQTQS